MSSVSTSGSGAAKSALNLGRIWDQYGMLVVFAALFLADELNDMRRDTAARQQRLALEAEDEPAAQAIEALAARIEKLRTGLAARATDA